MIRVLLVNPPRRQFPGLNQFIVSLPLGLLYLAAHAREHLADVELRVLDCLIEGDGGVAEDGELCGLDPNRMGLWLGDDAFDVVGVSFPFSTQEAAGGDTVRALRRALPRASIVVGGPHVTVAFERLLKQCPEIDVCVIGEGELTFTDLLARYDKSDAGFRELGQIAGIAWRSSAGEVVVNAPRPRLEDLDELPFPAYDLIDVDAYATNPNGYYRASPFEDARHVNMVTSRGCPYDCVFCAIHLSMGHKWRPHSGAYVLRHIRYLKETFGVEFIHFEDDNLSHKVERFERIVAGIAETGGLAWDNQNGMRADGWTAERLQAVAASGCRLMVLSVESGVQRVLDDVIRKKLSLDDVRETVRLCHGVGLPMVVFFVIGLPGETLRDVRCTLRFALWLSERYEASVFVMAAVPYLGTRLNRICVAEGYLEKAVVPENLVNFIASHGGSLIRTPEFGPEDLARVAARFERLLRLVRWCRVLTHPRLLRLALRRRFDRRLGPVRTKEV